MGEEGPRRVFLHECAPGYAFVEGEGCTDVDECASDTADCLVGEQCENSVGGFECLACPEGYRNADGLDANDCEFQIDECAEGLANCSENATCTDSDGSFSCACNAGYDGDGVECTNIDECADASLNNCSDNATCTDADGSFGCVCNAGYDGDGVECTNIDECADASLNNCSECFVYRRRG